MNCLHKSKFLSFATTILILLSLFVLFSLPVYGQTDILSTGIGARSLALGGAVAADYSNISVLYWSPAGLDFNNGNRVSAFLSHLLEKTVLSYTGFTLQTRKHGTFGVNYLNVTTHGIFTRQENGTFNRSVNYCEQMLLASYSKIIFESFAIGINFKIQHTRMEGIFSSNSALGADLGLIYKPKISHSLFQDTSYGLMLWNAIPPKIRTGSKNIEEIRPRLIKFGLGKLIKFSRNEVLIVTDLTVFEIESPKVHTGIEYRYHNWLYFRVGTNAGGLNWGFGFQVKKFNVDYWCGQYTKKSDHFFHGISINFQWGKTRNRFETDAELRFNSAVSKQLN